MIEPQTDESTHTDVLVPGARPSLPGRLRLSVLSGPDRGAELVLERGTYLVGKDPGCALVLRDPAVSRQHLEVAVTADGVRLRDLGSRNGTLSSGVRFTEITVGPGALIAL